MLVAMAVLALIVVILSSLINQVSTTWTTSESSNERRQNGRFIIDAISRDLQVAMLPVARSATDSLQFIKNPASVSELYPDAVFWQAPIASNSSLGEIEEVGYFVRWLSLPGSQCQAVLCRFAVNAEGQNGAPNSEYRIVTDPGNWVNSDLLSNVAPADKAHQYEGLFAENVIGFWAKCLDRAGNDLGAYDSRKSISPGTLPAAVEVGVVVLDSRSASRVTPALRDRLIALAQDRSRAPTAEAFLRTLLSDNSFSSLSGGARAFSTTVPILSSK